MPDIGTARADFLHVDARLLWRSIQRILALADNTRLFTGHDYGRGVRPVRYASSVLEQRALNVHVAARNEGEFVLLRTARDRALPPPALSEQAMAFNLFGIGPSERAAGA